MAARPRRFGPEPAFIFARFHQGTDEIARSEDEIARSEEVM